MADQSVPDGPREQFLPRALVLIILVVVLDLWASHHFGFGFQHPAALAGVLTALGFAAGLVGKLVPKAENESARAWLIARLQRVFTPQVVAALVVVSSLLLATGSSVMVIDESGAGASAVRLYALGKQDDATQARLESDAGFVRFPVVTSPFGRPYRVEAEGYVPGTFQVYPIVGRRVILGRDLATVPSLLLRPSVAAMGSLANGGLLRVSRAEANRDSLLIELPGRRSTFLIGRRWPIPSEMIEDWHRELGAEQAPPELIDETILAWKTPVSVPSPGGIYPGTTIVAEVFSRAGKLVARGEVTLGSERLVDLRVR